MTELCYFMRMSDQNRSWINVIEGPKHMSSYVNHQIKISLSLLLLRDTPSSVTEAEVQGLHLHLTIANSHNPRRLICIRVNSPSPIANSSTFCPFFRSTLSTVPEPGNQEAISRLGQSGQRLMGKTPARCSLAGGSVCVHASITVWSTMRLE